MNTKWLKIKAGKNVYDKLRRDGLNKEDIKIWSGAAGGPKWIILSELDKYLTKYYFNNIKHEMHFIGGSIGAWRAACYAINDSHEAISNLQHAYINQRYEREIPNPSEVTQKIKEIISSAIGTEGINNLLEPDNKYLHIMTSALKFKTINDPDWKIKAKFGWLALNYMCSRMSINRFSTRNVFSNYPKTIINDDGIIAHHETYNIHTLPKALAATGSIPMSMEGIVIDNIEHRDGGLVDYHLDLDYDLKDGIVFYPHFYPYIKPGWFDKFNTYRKSKYHQNTLLLYPSDALMQKLPNQKLSELKDFYTYSQDADLRIKIWNQVAEIGKYMVEDFEHISNNTNIFQDNLELWD